MSAWCGARRRRGLPDRRLRRRGQRAARRSGRRRRLRVAARARRRDAVRESSDLDAISDESVRSWFLGVRERLRARARDARRRSARLRRDGAARDRERASSALRATRRRRHRRAPAADEPFEVALWPDGGEYANQTFFVTDDGAPERIATAPLRPRCATWSPSRTGCRTSRSSARRAAPSRRSSDRWSRPCARATAAATACARTAGLSQFATRSTAHRRRQVARRRLPDRGDG